MQLFNKNGRGAVELVQVLGLIDSDLTFDKWEPVVPLGVRDLKAIIGEEAVAALDAHYQSNDWERPEKAAMNEAVRLAQQSAAMFTWLKVIPTLEAQHGNAGRGKRLGENERGLTGAQEFKDEDNIRNMAYEAADALVEYMDREAFDWWTQSRRKRQMEQLLIRDKETFDEYYTTGSHRLFLTLVPMIREVQDEHIIPILTRARFDRLLAGHPAEGEEELLEAARRPLALLAIKKAVERLPVEVLPTGIVQVQQTATVRDKVRAERQAREAVSTSLGNDAAVMLDRLTDLVAELDATGPDYYVPGPTLQSRGISF